MPVSVYHMTMPVRGSTPTTGPEFRVWAASCSHVGTDLRVAGRRSLAEAIRQSEDGGTEGGPPFAWDICLHLGDLSGSQIPPGDEEGAEVVRQFRAARRHRREDFYNIVGNHDASGPDEDCQWWFRTWVDPEGRNTATSGVDARRRPFAIDGTWERYSFRVGNVLFLLMSDRNDGGPPVGRAARGGYPAGAVTDETFRWWRQMVEDNQDCIIVSAHHHMLKETTVASGPWEGFARAPDGSKRNYHGYFADGAPQGASYLYFVGGRPDAQEFERYLAEHPACIDLWLGGHTHTNPDDTRGGRSHVERKWGVTFVNVAALARHHAAYTTVPMSRHFSFVPGRAEVLIRCYLHTSDHAPQGWYERAQRIAPLRHPFRR